MIFARSGQKSKNKKIWLSNFVCLIVYTDRHLFDTNIICRLPRRGVTAPGRSGKNLMTSISGKKGQIELTFVW